MEQDTQYVIHYSFVMTDKSDERSGTTYHELFSGTNLTDMLNVLMMLDRKQDKERTILSITKREGGHTNV